MTQNKERKNRENKWAKIENRVEAKERGKDEDISGGRGKGDKAGSSALIKVFKTSSFSRC